MLDWIKENFIYISLVFNLIFLVIFIVWLLLKKVDFKKIFKLISLIPTLIKTAEDLFPNGHGDNKKSIVLNLFNNLADQYGLTKYIKYFNVDYFIEDVLTSPKIGGDDDEQKSS